MRRGAGCNVRPHHGAKNSTREGLPDLSTILSKLSGFRSMTSEMAEAPVASVANSAVILILCDRVVDSSV